MRLSELMTETPPTCLHCGAGNVPDGDTGEIRPCINLERDVNWGDSTYLCAKCADQVAALMGWSTPDDLADAQRQIQKLEAELHEVTASYEKAVRIAKQHKRRLETVVHGEEIRKKLKRVVA